jgi:hypothetical protein
MVSHGFREAMQKTEKNLNSLPLRRSTLPAASRLRGPS